LILMHRFWTRKNSLVHTSAASDQWVEYIRTSAFPEAI
jgi:hypothetical protein